MKFTTTVFCAAMATLMLAGCASPPTRYYTLAAPVPAVAPAAPPAAAAPLWIELAPVGMPERLARPQLVVRPAGDGSRAEVEILEQHRWASSFENELRDALASGIAARLGAHDGTRGGRPAAAPVTRIAVQLRQFDAVEGGKVEADLGWTLRRTEQPRSMVCQISLSEPVGGTGIDAVAQGAQRLTANASAAIARSVAALQQNPDAACPI
ncbi:MAG: PqiC family protein [Variovorax sp.]